MSNWISLTNDDLKSAGYGAIVDKAQTLAVGGVDPVADHLANAVARVRNAIAVTNAVDVDPTKVPRSLKDLTARLVLFALMNRIGLPLSQDQRDQRTTDNADLKQIAERKVRVELPDNPDPNSTPVNPGNWNANNKVLMRTDPVPCPDAQFPPSGGNYANPNAPTDAP